MAGEEETTTTSSETTLETTPTWAVATVVFVLILVSIFLEYLLHLLAKYFNKKRRKSLIQALDKIKSGETFLPCDDPLNDSEEEAKCQEQGKVSLLSRQGVRELQYLMFTLAFFHCLSCVLTFSLGMAKMRRWKSWEAETTTLEYLFSNGKLLGLGTVEKVGQDFELLEFGEVLGLRVPSSTTKEIDVACFVRQFYSSVSKVDYFTLRHGFITAHFSEGSNFDFQKYIKRALVKDFGVVVGIRLVYFI
ncbi:hypothetical protein Golob_003330 [Gossypium lobatum]|uniref:Uncharacterized protein n=1 Tax=Gossypium lobatum TaxID=34289 RepID=A0A7J8MY10_9ROSI|nr:hypothetical protein [Gossypium lobatum]